MRETNRAAEYMGRVRVEGPEGKEIVVAGKTLSGRGAERMEALVRKALLGKGYDPKLIDLACQEVREQLTNDLKEMP